MFTLYRWGKQIFHTGIFSSTQHPRERERTSEKGTTAVECNALHDPMLQILLNHLWEVSLQWIFTITYKNLITQKSFQAKINKSLKRERMSGSSPIMGAFIGLDFCFRERKGLDRERQRQHTSGVVPRRKKEAKLNSGLRIWLQWSFIHPVNPK